MTPVSTETRTRLELFAECCDELIVDSFDSAVKDQDMELRYLPPRHHVTSSSIVDTNSVSLEPSQC